MRIIINQLPALGHRTGVGQYTANLVRALRGLNDAQVSTFPDLWLQRIQEVGPAAGPWKRPWFAPANVTTAARCFSHWGRRAVRRAFRPVIQAREAAFRDGTGYDIYLEPNFIPLSSALPTVTTIHDMSVFAHPEWHPVERIDWFERNFSRSLRQSAHFLADSDFTRAEVMRLAGIAPERITRVHAGVRPEFRPLSETLTRRALKRLGLPERYLLHVGTIEPRKNLLRLMQAYCALPGPLRDRCSLVLAGPWGWKYEAIGRYYEDEARHRGVLVLGYVQDRDLPALYNGARALVYPSFYEGFGLPPIEMMASGGAVLASKAAAVAEVVGDRAHLIGAHDDAGWYEALVRIISDDGWQRLLRLGGREVAARYSWRRCAQETAQVLRGVLNSSRNQRAA
jgi:alpha-1,3-rhamnosyl/mannosyltransferase